MDKKEYKAPKLQSYGSIEQFTFTQPGGNNEEEFQYFYHYYRRRRLPSSWSEQSLPTFPSS
jgi:hypothetical protein